MPIDFDPFTKLKQDADQGAVDFIVFTGKRAFDTQGFAENTTGRAGTAEVDQQKLDLIEARKQRQNSRDRSIEHLQLGFELREARINQVFAGFSEEDLDFAIQETLDNIDDVAARHGLDADEKSQLESWLLAYQSASPQDKAAILDNIARTYPSIAEEMAETASVARDRRLQSELNGEEVSARDISLTDDDNAFRKAASEDFAETEVARAELARDGLSSSDNPFEVGFSPSADFQAHASLAGAAPLVEPDEAAPEHSGPTPT